MFSLIPVAEASVETLMKNIDRVIINPIIFFMFAVAMVYFLYGLVQYLVSPGNEEVRKKSKSVMLWGTFGLFIMVAVFGIMKLILSTLGENKIKINNVGQYVVEKVDINKNGDIVPATNTPLLDVNKDSKAGPVLFETKSEVDVPHTTFLKNPFPTYKKSSGGLCWNQTFMSTTIARSDIDSERADEAVVQASKKARDAYLNSNNILATDKTKLNYPIIYATKVLYEKKANTYYGWIDARAPINKGTISDCRLALTAQAPALPYRIVFSDTKATVDDINQSIGENLGIQIKDSDMSTYTISPFKRVYKPSPLCWRKELYTKAMSEFRAREDMKVEARNQYLTDNNLTDISAPEKFPVSYGDQVAYDKTTKFYYVWWDARGPINGGKESDCNLPIVGSDLEPVLQSKKQNPFTVEYTSDATYYRVVDSGVDPDYSTARNIAINNAIIQIAKIKNLNIISSIKIHKILAERYYPKDIVTGNLDYWIAIEFYK